MGIKAYDYMDGVNNHYGVYSVVLTVDGNEIFRSTVDPVSYTHLDVYKRQLIYSE